MTGFVTGISAKCALASDLHGAPLLCYRRPRSSHGPFRKPRKSMLSACTSVISGVDADPDVSGEPVSKSLTNIPPVDESEELNDGASMVPVTVVPQMDSGFYVASEQDYVDIQRDNSDQAQNSDSEGNSSGAIDLLELDSAGRNVLDSGSYSSVIDVNILAGGLLKLKDKDNNELFTGVGMEALLENELLTENLRKEFSITTATHVQLAAIPRIQQGDDIVMQSHTGTGKTLAFLLPLLESIDPDFPHTQAVVIAPTRELAMQIYGECTRLSTGTNILSMALIGGANPARQIEKLRKRTPHVLVGTPGRLAELEDQRALHLRKVRMVVVDEVDHSLQETFRGSIERLLHRIPKSRQLVLVSATGDVDMVREFATKEMRQSVLLRVGDKQLVPKNIVNWYAVVPPRLRIETLRKLMNADPVPERAICFVNDPRRVDLVIERLYYMKISAAALRGNAHKLERAEVIKAFRTGRVRLLVTTEIAARGLDVREVSHVFNLDLPTDADHYIHRAGRCGRAGANGVVVSIAVPETAFVINRLEKRLGLTITRMEPRDGRYSKPIDHTTDRSPTRGTRNAKPVKEDRPSKEKKLGKPRSSNRKETSGVQPGVSSQEKNISEASPRKPHKKIRHSKARKAQPKVRVTSRDVRIQAKKQGWVGNRAPGPKKSEST